MPTASFSHDRLNAWTGQHFADLGGQDAGKRVPPSYPSQDNQEAIQRAEKATDTRRIENASSPGSLFFGTKSQFALIHGGSKGTARPRLRDCKYIHDYNGGMAPDLPDKTSTLPPDFQQAANPAFPIIEPPKVMVSLPLDADLLAYFQSETGLGDWQRHMNDVLRFYVETSQMADADAELAVSMAQQDAPQP